MGKTKILISGASGMLGATLVNLWQDRFDIYATGKNNFIGNPAEKFMSFNLYNKSYKPLINWADPEIIIHCAAITDSDYCENNPDQALEVNAISTDRFIKSKLNARIIFISSDAVFPDGLHLATEKDQVAPLNVYGKTKVVGEKIIQNIGRPHSVIRTTIVGTNINPSKKSFIDKMVSKLRNGEIISLFGDDFFTPITIWDFAQELEWIISNDFHGTIHITGKEPISKYDFGLKISKKLGFDRGLISKNSINDINFIAKRSKDKTMSSKYYEQLSNRSMPTVNDTISTIVKHLKRRAKIV